eukprot:TRINITY_DN6892_c0_g1_i2.p1 TRINITY_DN6892_c0_g1~~TRINITY_DN6892_c0_g1_i2.p1  ORF type:complete len:1242 (-),score=332.82 TRINITY_DN6892_c0_g1_i2:42-3767(-)
MWNGLGIDATFPPSLSPSFLNINAQGNVVDILILRAYGSNFTQKLGNFVISGFPAVEIYGFRFLDNLGSLSIDAADSIVMKDCSFISRYYPRLPLYFVGSSLSLDSCTFAESDSLFVIGSVTDVQINKCTFSDLNLTNTTRYYVQQLNITDSLFRNSKLQNPLFTSASDSTKVNLQKCDFALLTSSGSSNAPTIMDIHGGTLNMRDCTFRDNLVNYQSQGMIVMAKGELFNCAFQNNQGGSCIFINATEVNIIESNFLHNEVGNWAALHIVSGSTAISQCRFEYNLAIAYGGAIYNGGNLTISSSVFEGNEASHGGAVYSQGQTLLEYSTLMYNKASIDGGALYSSGVFSFHDCKFEWNNGDSWDGVSIYFTDRSTSLALNSVYRCDRFRESPLWISPSLYQEKFPTEGESITVDLNPFGPPGFTPTTINGTGGVKLLLEREKLSITVPPGSGRDFEVFANDYCFRPGVFISFIPPHVDSFIVEGNIMTINGSNFGRNASKIIITNEYQTRLCKEGSIQIIQNSSSLQCQIENPVSLGSIQTMNIETSTSNGFVPRNLLRTAILYQGKVYLLLNKVVSDFKVNISEGNIVMQLTKTLGNSNNDLWSAEFSSPQTGGNFTTRISNGLLSTINLVFGTLQGTVLKDPSFDIQYCSLYTILPNIPSFPYFSNFVQRCSVSNPQVGLETISMVTEPGDLFSLLVDLGLNLIKKNTTASSLVSSNGISLTVALLKDPILNKSISFPQKLISEIDQIEGSFVMLQTFPLNVTGLLFHSTSEDKAPLSQVVGVLVLDSNGKEIELKDLKENITIIIPYDSKSSEKPLECIWWDSKINVWTNEGCSYSTIGEGLSSCQCNHLTNFSIGSLKSNPTSLAQAFPPNSTLPVGLIIGVCLAGVFLLVLVAIVFIIMRRKKGERKHGRENAIELENSLNLLPMSLNVEIKVGEGEYGSHYQGIYSSTAVLVRPLEKREKMIEFMNESNLLKTLHHPNCVQYLGLIKSDDKMSIISEFPPLLLSDFLSNKEFVKSHLALLSIGRDVASAMNYLENQGIVHGMIQAKSVFLRREEDGYIAKLSNFGVASRLKEKEPIRDFPVRWSSPELIETKKPTFKSDVYAFGVFLYELLEEGKVPFSNNKDGQVRKIVRRGTFNQSLQFTFKSEPIQKLVNECVDKEEDKRPSALTIFRYLSSVIPEKRSNAATNMVQQEGEDQNSASRHYGSLIFQLDGNIVPVDEPTSSDPMPSDHYSRL